MYKTLSQEHAIPSDGLRGYFEMSLGQKWSTWRWILGLYENARLENLDSTSVSLHSTFYRLSTLSIQARAGEGVIYR